MIDSRLVATPFNEPTLWTGRFVGAGTNTKPTAIAYTSKKLTLTYGNLGAMNVTLSDPTVGQSGNGLTGVVQCYDFWIASPLKGGANLKQVCITPPTVNSAVFVLQVQYANGTAIDIASTEELVCEIWTSRSASP